VSLETPRFRCKSCGRTQNLDLPILDEKRRATRRLLESVRGQCLSKPFHRLSEETGLAVNTIKNFAQDLVDELDRGGKTATPRLMGIGELNLAGGKCLMIINLATQSVVDILRERGHKDLKHSFHNLPDRDRVEWVCIEPTKQIREIVPHCFPNAAVVDGHPNGLKSATREFQERLADALKAATKGIEMVAGKFGHGYSFEILRARILYANYAREVARSTPWMEETTNGNSVNLVDLHADSVVTARTSISIEYGAHIPTLVEMAERGAFA